MNTEQKALLDIVKIGATGECSFGHSVIETDWQKLFELACKHGVVCVAWHGIELLYKQGVNECPADIKLHLYARRGQIEKAASKNLAIAIDFANAVYPLKFVVLKGIDYSQYWPNPLWREFGDLDCYSVNGDTEAIDKRAEEIGCEVDDEDYKHSHIRYKGLMVENHHCFTSFGGSKKGEELERELQSLFKVASSNIQGSGLLSPSVDFTAVFMLAHAQNHFFYEGITLRQILDWHFFLTKDGKNVDWNTVTPIMERTGLKTFASLLTVFCQKHFGLQQQVVPIVAGGIDNELLQRFEEDLFSEQMNPNDRRPLEMVMRMLHRYGRMCKFRKLNKMPVPTAVWRTIAFSSFLHRKPKI